ncbi:MAG TPA: gas vesicle protein [Nanoarchaeota archaeon]|nr:gas vesicle protein [Nanoarchaeota archaeon]
MKGNTDIGIVELIDRTLNKGVILNADLIITVADIPLLAANLKLALASVETMLKYGIMNDWLEASSFRGNIPIKTLEVEPDKIRAKVYSQA